jgi:hypothetical protein
LSVVENFDEPVNYTFFADGGAVVNGGGGVLDLGWVRGVGCLGVELRQGGQGASVELLGGEVSARVATACLPAEGHTMLIDEHAIGSIWDRGDALLLAHRKTG